MTNLSKVTDVFSDILAKSKWGQQPVPGNFIPHPKGGGKGRKVSGSFEPDASVPDKSSYIIGMEKARMLKAFGVMKATGGRYNLHPVEPRSKTAVELARKYDGGEKANSGARGATPAILGMIKARRKRVSEMTGAEIIAANKQGELRIDRSYRPGQGPHPEYDKESPDPHGDNLREPYGDTWKEAALLYPAHKKEQQGGRKVKTRVGDSIGGYPT